MAPPDDTPSTERLWFPPAAAPDACELPARSPLPPLPRLPLPPQQLEVLHAGQLVATHTVTWPPDAPEAIADLSTLASLHIGQLYDVRVVESAAVLPVRLQCAKIGRAHV